MNKFWSLFLLCICFLSSFTGLQGPVMCYSSDGHIEVEYAHVDHCETEIPPPCTDTDHVFNPGNTAHDHEHEQPSPCVDIPFSDTSLHTARIDYQPKPLLFEYHAYSISNVLNQCVELPPQRFTHVQRVSQPIASHTLTALSTVILLT